MLWSTSMEIPVGAPNPQAAQAFIDFVYDPEVQADIAEWVNYVTPGRRRQGDPAKARPRAREKPAHLPERGVHGELQLRAGARRGAGRGGHRGIPASGRFDRCGCSRSPHSRPRRSFRDPAATLRLLGERVAARAGHVPRRAARDVPGAPPAERAAAARARTGEPGRPRRGRARSAHGRARRDRPGERGLARAGLGLRAGGRRARAQHLPRVLSRGRARGAATGRCSRGSRTRPTAPGDGVRDLRHPGRRPRRAVASVTTAASPRPAGSSPGWAPRWCSSRASRPRATATRRSSWHAPTRSSTSSTWSH